MRTSTALRIAKAVNQHIDASAPASPAMIETRQPVSTLPRATRSRASR
jgi:hypothetical protein